MPKKTFLKILSLIAVVIVAVFLSAGFSANQSQTIAASILNTASAPSDFILNWSSDSYIPPGYEGKALPTRNSVIRVAAAPLKNLAADSQKFYYTWLLDDEIAGWANGQGKSVFKFQASKWPGEFHEIKVQITDSQENLLFQQRLQIKIVSPELLTVQNSQNYAIQNKLTAKTGQDLNIQAVPLFFNIKNLAGLDWQWTFSGQPLASEDQKDLNLLTLKIPAANITSSLQKELSVTATDKNDQTQQGSVIFTIEIK